MNILLTCAGRRNYLVNYFREALSGVGAVYAVDSIGTAPALHEADKAFIVPPVSDPDYIDTLVKICRNYNIKLVFSLNDLELPLLAREKQRFLQLGVIPVVSETNVIDLCFDKWATHSFLAELGIDRARTYLTLDNAVHALAEGELAFPIVVKPRWGTASQLIEYPQNPEELKLAYLLSQQRLKHSILPQVSPEGSNHYSLLIQEKLPGEEYGLDIVNDLNGHYVTTFVKRKLGMRSGETDKAVTVVHQELSILGQKIGETLGHIGNLDCDVFVSEERLAVLEMNPRFGGGYPFSHAAGANLPAALIAWAKGEEAQSSHLQITPGVASAKCDRLVRVSCFENFESKFI